MAKLVARLLVSAALWVRIVDTGYLLKVQNGRQKQRSGQQTLEKHLAHDKNIFLSKTKICDTFCSIFVFGWDGGAFGGLESGKKSKFP
jgi:hypothetical protein